MTNPDEERPHILLIAPNVSRFMGGEAIKSLHILEGCQQLGFKVQQISHARVREEMSAHAPPLPIDYVEDGPVQIGLYRLRLFWLLNMVGSWLMTRKAQRYIDENKPWLVHITAPISPSYPFFRLRGAPVIIGPLNGNLLHPPGFLYRESRAKLMGARLLRPVQMIARFLFRGTRHARLFISGGERTVKALEMAGCDRAQMVFTLDSGVSDELREHPRLTHNGVRHRFVFVGRLVRYKACDLAIKALRQAPEATLDVIGDGPERGALEALAREEGVAHRVNFLGYIPAGSAMFRRWRDYRAFVFPTLAEANGIVIQEAMIIGLPVVAVDWGGPAQLLDAETGILIEPRDEESVVKGLAEAMVRLANQPDLAESLSREARAKAECLGFDWRSVMLNWQRHYDKWLAETGSPHRFLRAPAAEVDLRGEG